MADEDEGEGGVGGEDEGRRAQRAGSAADAEPAAVGQEARVREHGGEREREQEREREEQKEDEEDADDDDEADTDDDEDFVAPVVKPPGQIFIRAQLTLRPPQQGPLLEEDVDEVLRS
jgi:hypothetical protein